MMEIIIFDGQFERVREFELNHSGGGVYATAETTLAPGQMHEYNHVHVTVDDMLVLLENVYVSNYETDFSDPWATIEFTALSMSTRLL